jgi:hypothetical protein
MTSPTRVKLGSVEAVELFEAIERRADGVIMWLRSIKADRSGLSYLHR